MSKWKTIRHLTDFLKIGELARELMVGLEDGKLTDSELKLIIDRLKIVLVRVGLMDG